MILVLAGDNNGERVAEAVNLYKQGYAKNILMSGGPFAWKLTYAWWMKKQALESGIPAKAILMQDRSFSTKDDARFSLPIVKARGFKSVLLVTSPFHTRRAARSFKKLFGPAGISVRVYPVQKSSYNPKRWWTRHEDTEFVVREYISMLLYTLRGY